MKKKRGLVQWQTSKSQDVRNENGESFLANPDMLVEQDSSPSTPQLLMGEAIEHLQGRQREVYLLTMREGQSLAEAAEALGLTKSSVQTYLNRAIAFISQYCQAAIAKDRV